MDNGATFVKKKHIQRLKMRASTHADWCLGVSECKNRKWRWQWCLCVRVCLVQQKQQLCKKCGSTYFERSSQTCYVCVCVSRTREEKNPTCICTDTHSMWVVLICCIRQYVSTTYHAGSAATREFLLSDNVKFLRRKIVSFLLVGCLSRLFDSKKIRRIWRQWPLICKIMFFPTECCLFTILY